MSNSKLDMRMVLSLDSMRNELQQRGPRIPGSEQDLAVDITGTINVQRTTPAAGEATMDDSHSDVTGDHVFFDHSTGYMVDTTGSLSDTLQAVFGDLCDFAQTVPAVTDEVTKDDLIELGTALASGLLLASFASIALVRCSVSLASQTVKHAVISKIGQVKAS